MRRRIWLVALILYAAVGVADAGYRLANLPPAGSRSSFVASLAVAFCAGLFWPIDIVAGPLLAPR
jgi:hypothetical protein